MNWKTSRPPINETILVRAVRRDEQDEMFAVTRILDEIQKDGSVFVWHSVEGCSGYDSENDFGVEEITHWCEITKPEGTK